MGNLIEDLKKKKETIWINPDREAVPVHCEINGKKFVHVRAAQARLMRFMPYFEKVFPETEKRKGIIESELIPIDSMREYLGLESSISKGKLLLKDDAHLPISGSVKARGGIYEVIKFAETLAMKHQMIMPTDDYSVFASESFRKLFSEYTIQVGSTGNLGLSIGIMSAKLGFRTKVHMSVDAKQWKKDMLRANGVEVMEYDSDYSYAVSMGRKLSAGDPNSYFIDDENSEDLFMGYAAAALRLKVQLSKKGIFVDKEHPLFVYIPCGVGGAPGGITFGLKEVFGDSVHCFFVEPVNAPCFILGMATGEYNNICIQDIGLDGRTVADGLAVGRASGFSSSMMVPLLSGCMTVTDDELMKYKDEIKISENIYLEASACAGFHGVKMLLGRSEAKQYLTENALSEYLTNAAHVVWATGGGLEERNISLKTM